MAQVRNNGSTIIVGGVETAGQALDLPPDLVLARQLVADKFPNARFADFSSGRLATTRTKRRFGQGELAHSFPPWEWKEQTKTVFCQLDDKQQKNYPGLW